MSEGSTMTKEDRRMKTRKDAERVVELCQERDRLHARAATIRMAKPIAVCDPNEGKGLPRLGPHNLLHVTHLADELRSLIDREADRQIAAINKELEGLGVVPDEFEVAAPEA